MLTTAILLIAIQSGDLQSAIQRVESQIEKTRAEIARLEQRRRQDKEKQQVEADKRQINILHQQLLELGNRLGSYQSEHTSQEALKRLKKLFPEVLPIPPEHSVSPRSTNRT